jgi:acyl-CoA synthetase (AMP-forming)/AMP-acid ligase II
MIGALGTAAAQPSPGARMAIDVESLYDRRADNRWDRTCIGDVLERVTWSRPDRVAITGWPGAFATPEFERLTYREADEVVNRVAQGLLARGLQRGNRVLLLCENSVEAYLLKLGVAKAGMVNVPLNPSLAPDVITRLVALAEPRFAVVDAELWPAVQPAFESAGISPDVTIGIGGGPVVGSVAFPEFLAGASPEEPDTVVHGDDIWELLFTSGTTALPKGVMLTHASIGVNLAQVDALHTMTPEDRIIAVLPFFHIYGMTALMNLPLRKGATVVVLPRFDLTQFLDVLEKYRITRAHVAPPVVLALAKHPAVEGRDFSALRFILSAAAPLDGALARLAAERLQVDIGQGYGMTELSPGTHLVPDGRAAEAPPGSIGRLVPSTEARLVSLETGEDVGPGEEGEIWIRGPQRMKGYFGRPEETDTMIDADGWLHTGDIGRVDADGWWFVVDRVKELIKYKGYQVAPAELEAVLIGNPDIADAAVIGVKDDATGEELPKAFIVRAPGSSISEQEVMDYAASRLAPHKKIRAVEFIEQVPKSAAGKILRKNLKAR